MAGTYVGASVSELIFNWKTSVSRILVKADLNIEGTALIKNAV